MLGDYTAEKETNQTSPKEIHEKMFRWKTKKGILAHIYVSKTVHMKESSIYNLTVVWSKCIGWSAPPTQ